MSWERGLPQGENGWIDPAAWRMLSFFGQRPHEPFAAAAAWLRAADYLSDVEQLLGATSFRFDPDHDEAGGPYQLTLFLDELGLRELAARKTRCGRRLRTAEPDAGPDPTPGGTPSRSGRTAP